MGITLQGAGALAGGTAEGYNVGTRTQLARQAEGRAQAEEIRTQEQYDLEKTFRDIFSEREKVDQPDPPAQPQAVPTGEPGAEMGALPDDPNSLGAMSVRGAPAQRTRRDKYNEWKDQAQAAAVRSGGMQGLEAFNRMEGEISRQQIMGYGLEAVRALNGGSAGEAAKLANTALESSPNETGLEYFAMNGELYMQGADGEPSGPLGVDHLRVLVEDYMKTPESFLAWQKQLEDERKNKEAETDRDAQIGINERAVEVQEGALPSQNLARAAGAFKDISIGDAATQKALTATEEDLGWNNNNKLKIMNDLMVMQLDEKLGLDGEWNSALSQNPELAKLSVSNMTDIVTYNPAGHVNYGDAAGIVRAAHGPSLGLSSSVTSLPTMEVDGQYYVRFNGKEFGIPQTVYEAIQAQKGGGGQ